MPPKAAEKPARAPKAKAPRVTRDRMTDDDHLAKLIAFVEALALGRPAEASFVSSDGLTSPPGVSHEGSRSGSLVATPHGTRKSARTWGIIA